MASLIWTAVWYFLMFELIVTLILVIPVPRKIRNMLARQVNKLDLGQRLAKVGIFVTIALAAALVESVSSIQTISERERTEAHHGFSAGSVEHDRILHDLDKQRKFRSERNMYLAGFSLTLLFVIVRIANLMQESVEWEEQVEVLTKAVASEQPSGAPSDGVEMTTIKSKQEKKKD
jgi:B-cell receptor-associated protein 31